MAPKSTPSTPPPPTAITDAVIKRYAAAKHIPIAVARSQIQAAQQGGAAFQPFGLQGNADQGQLYLGPNVVAGRTTAEVPGLPIQSNKTKNYTVTWLGQRINVRAPDMGAGYTVHLRASLAGSNVPAGGVYSRQDIDRIMQDYRHITQNVYNKGEQTLASKSSFWIEIDDAKGKSVWQKNLEEIQPGAGMILMGGAQFRPGQGKDVIGKDWAINPYVDAAKVLTTTSDKTTDRTGQIDAELKKLYVLAVENPKQLVSYKHELWLAGYYGKVPLDQVNMTTLTNEDMTAFGEVMTGAARYYAAKQDITWQDLLHKEAADPSAKKRAAKADAEPVIPLTDPAAITKAANKTATDVLGHKPNPDDVSAIISLLHNKEKIYGEASNSGEGGTAVNPDPAADIEQYFRDKYPTEAMAVDWGAQAQVWDQLLATPANMPSTVK